VQLPTEYLTAAEVAAVLKLSPESVISRFQNRKGVLDLGSPESRFKRRYRVLRIPREALDAYRTERSAANSTNGKGKQ